MKSGAKAVEACEKKLLAGEIDKPFPCDGRSNKNLVRLEEIRKKMLEDKIRQESKYAEIDERVAGVAHDLKTPIATISGYAECIQDGIDDKDYPKLIIDKAREMNEQVISIVDSVRKAKTDGEKRCVRFDTFLERAVQETSGGAEAKNISVKIKRLPKAYVYIDLRKTARVVENIISNAVKYTPAGGKITVRAKVWAGKYVVEIKDTGVGIKKADQRHIFEKFFMGDKSRGGQGSGLGLFISKEFVEEHGGSIAVKSNGKKGCRVIFDLPIVHSEEKLPATERFERKNLAGKLLIIFFFWWIFCAVYRFVKYAEKKSASTLIAAFLCLIPLPFMWAVDFIGEIFYGRITFLAD